MMIERYAVHISYLWMETFLVARSLNFIRYPLLILCVFSLASCQPATQAAQYIPETPPLQTETSSSTPTLTFTHTPSHTPTASLTPTNSTTPTISLTPTYTFPSVVVNVANAHCQFGPHKAYLHARDLHQGYTGKVWGKDADNQWLYVKFDLLSIPCWVHRSLVDITGDFTLMLVQRTNLPITDALYAAPEQVWSERDPQTNTVVVNWSTVWMTEDDDRGYFLDVWVCQSGNLVWMPASVSNQYTTQYIFTDESGCSDPSGGKLYTVEKHGYTTPTTIPWPP